MGSVTYSGTTTSGQNGGIVAQGALPQFTGPWTATVATADGSENPGATINWRVSFIRSSDGFVCYSIGVSIVGSASNSVGYSVPNTGGTYAALDWDTVRWSIESALGTPAKEWTFTVTAGFAPLAYCAYGVEANPSAQVYETITDLTIDVVVGAIFAGRVPPTVLAAIETGLAGLEGAIWFGVSCDTLPNPNQEALDLTNIQNWSPDRLLAWFQTAAWHFFCQCKAAPAGSPSPVLPPPPPIVEPPTSYPPAPISCDLSDLCAYLTAMSRKLDNMNRSLSTVLSEVTLIQRQHVPTGYQRGASHQNLSGIGSFTVSGILGLSVAFSARPVGVGSDMDPTARSYWNLGYLNLGTVDGWMRRLRITHDPMLVLDLDAIISTVEYDLPNGAVATIQELVREP